MQVEDGTHIAENITSIAELKQKHSRVTLLTSLWLHGNWIERITDMNDFLYLVELDLSSNRIQKIEGLGMLSNLSCLNLASNKIKIIEGLGELHKLKKLVLSYNRIESLEGLTTLHGERYMLEHLDVRGNNIKQLGEIKYLSGLINLKQVFFKSEGSNPVCEDNRYDSFVSTKVPKLEVFDGVHLAETSHSNDFDPVLAKYLEYLDDSEELGIKAATPISPPLPPVHTPKIDSVMKIFRNSKDHYEKRVTSLEHDLAQLREKMKDRVSEPEYIPSPQHFRVSTSNTSIQVGVATREESIQVEDKSEVDQLQEMKNKVERLESEETKLRSQIEKLCEELGSAKVYVEHKEQELAQEMIKRSNFENLVHSCKEELQTQKTKTKEAHTVIKQISKENTSLKEHCLHLQTEVTELRSELERFKNQEYVSVEKLRTTYETDIKRLRKENDDLKTKLETCEKNLDERTHDLEREQQLYKRTLDEQSTLHSQEMESILKRHTNELETMRIKDEEQMKKRVEELTTKYNEIVTQLQEKISEQQREYGKMETAFNEAAGNVSEMKTILKKYIQKEMHATSCAKESGDVLLKQKEVIEKLVKSKHDLERKCLQVEESIKGYESTIESLKQKHLEQIQTIQNENKRLVELGKSKDDLLRQLKKRYLQIEGENQDWQSKQKSFEIQFQNLRTNHEKELVNVEKKMKELQDLLAEQTNKVNVNKHVIDARDAEIVELKNRIREKDEDAKKQREKLKEMQYKLDDKSQIDSEMVELEDKLIELEEKYQRGKDRRAELREQMDVLVEQKEEVETKLEEMERQYNAKCEEIKQEKEASNEMKRTIATLEKKLTKLEMIQQSTDALIREKELLLNKLQWQEETIARLTQLANERQNEIKVVLRALDTQKRVAEEREKKLQKLTAMFDDVKRDWS